MTEINGRFSLATMAITIPDEMPNEAGISRILRAVRARQVVLLENPGDQPKPFRNVNTVEDASAIHREGLLYIADKKIPFALGREWWKRAIGMAELPSTAVEAQNFLREEASKSIPVIPLPPDTLPTGTLVHLVSIDNDESGRLVATHSTANIIGHEVYPRMGDNYSSVTYVTDDPKHKRIDKVNQIAEFYLDTWEWGNVILTTDPEVAKKAFRGIDFIQEGTLRLEKELARARLAPA